MKLKNKLKIFSAVFFMLVIVVSSSMVFAADPNTWTTKAPMETGRYDHEAVVLDGQVYIIGGQTTGAATLNSVEQYNPVTDTWTTKAPMTYARYGHQVSVVDGKIYTIGGMGSSGSMYSLEEYNPSTNTWSTKASMNTGRGYFATAVVNGKIYAMGGSSVKSVEEYDPANNIWTTKAPMSVDRMQFKVAVVNGKIFAIGGKSSTGSLNSVEEYDPATNTWTPKASMNIGRANFQMATLNGKIYVMSGSNTGNTGVYSSIEEYNPATDTWTTKATMPTSPEGRAAAINGKIYMTGVDGKTKGEEYDTATDKWTVDAPMSTERYHHSVVSLNGKLYAIGGTSGGTVLKSVEEYTPTSTEDGGTENPPVVTGNSAILELTMVNGVIKEYDLNADELDSFLTWYDNSSIGSAPAYYIFNKKNNIKPFLSRKEYIAYSKIASFEVKEYAE